MRSWRQRSGMALMTLACLPGLTMSTVTATPQTNSALVPVEQQTGPPSQEKLGNPFAPASGRPGRMQEYQSSTSLTGYRVAGIVFSNDKSLAVLQLPDKSFHIVEEGTVFNGMTILGISGQEVVLQTPLGDYRLPVSD